MSRGRTWEAEGPVQAYGDGCAAGEEPRPAALAGSARLNPRPSRTVNDHAIGCLIIYWIWLQSYLNTLVHSHADYVR